MRKRKNESVEDIPEDEFAAMARHELTEMEAALWQEVERLAKGKSKRSRSKMSAMTFAQAMMRYLQDDLLGAVEIMRKAVQKADKSMSNNQPYRFYMHAVLADWLSELGTTTAIEEARRHIEIAWTFVTTDQMGNVYLAEVKERKAKVEARMK